VVTVCGGCDAHMSQPIHNLLIANRGEIARRVQLSAHAMGIATVAVYADPDVNEPFVKEADLAIALRGATALETYLSMDKLLQAAASSGADAVHPGYGFLAENAEFAAAVIDAGLIWVGPSPDAIRAMGDKLSAKRLMRDAGVPQLPSAELAEDGSIEAVAQTVGYPLLVKAAAGGGGKGMRVVREETELRTAVEAAQREASAAFGDGTVFLERWLEQARHVEIQVLGDSHGNVVHCFERECSIQRRHQKIIEEAPSPAVSESLRERMGATAVAAARSIGYYSTGTVEFLLDGDEFFFLEMNTRLQVEHPVTEAVTGVDLVREQIRVACGEQLGVSQAELGIKGHAIEARLYAEDPQNGFLPATGDILFWQPAAVQGVRFDSGIERGSQVGIEFDPMLAKVISHAPTRSEATATLARALSSTRIHGVINNRNFLVNILRTDEFGRGDTTTDFIDRVGPATSTDVPEQVLADAAIACALSAQAQERADAAVLNGFPSGWRNTRMPAERREFGCHGSSLDVSYRCRRDGVFDCVIGDAAYSVRVLRRSNAAMELEIDNRQVSVLLERIGTRWLLALAGRDLELHERPRFPIAESDDKPGSFRAPMPGKVVSTHVVLGDRVESGQLLLILEAMKMEHRVVAPAAGTIDELNVQTGQQVSNGELLVVVS